MARLNEPPAPVETIESLKRRFMRQNRDIARVNSTQSLRIRSLENETSRLLAENLGLRGEIIRLKGEMENGKSQRKSAHTKAIKTQLESKLLEISALISGLDHEPTLQKHSPKTGNKTGTNACKSPNQRATKNIHALSEDMAAQEGRLPPILENKYYPRRTLEQQELTAILSGAAIDTTDSPDIGPPPVSQFVDEDPVKIDLPVKPRKPELEDIPGLDPAIAMNLEHRKKRKDSIAPMEPSMAIITELGQGMKEITGTLKTGAKRKLSAREEEEVDVETRKVEDIIDDFNFKRVISDERNRSRPGAILEKPASKMAKEKALSKGAPSEKVTGNTVPTRKVLAPKSVNNSPRKRGKDPLGHDAKPENVDLKSKEAEELSQQKMHVPVVIRSGQEPLIQANLVIPEPETPAALDILSPFESQPSTARGESRDTPPPADLGPESDGHRHSRRARGAVSYAEPNLRDKMRRPTKELVDAVAAEAKLKQNTVKVEEGINLHSMQLISGLGSTKIKTEPETDDSWKIMPLPSSITMENSPLGSKGSMSDSLPNSISTHRKRRESLLNQESEILRASSGNAMSALLASNRKARTEAKEKTLEGANLPAKAVDNVDVYECQGSPPPPLEEAPAKSVKIEKTSSRFSRRHTTVMRDSGPAPDIKDSNISGTRKAEGSVSHRRQSSVVPRGSSSINGDSRKENEDKHLRKAASSASMVTFGADSITGEPSRSDRIAARRRSMML